MAWLSNLRLRSSSPQTRRKAIESLTASSNLRDLKSLIASLHDEDPDVRRAAARALSTINAELSVASQAAVLAEANRRPSGLPAAPAKTTAVMRHLQPLLISAQHPDPAVRLAAIAALGKQAGPLVTEPLLDRLGDADPRVRLAAAQALEEQASPAHLAHFLALLADPHFEVRIAAIQFLRRFGDPAVAQALLPLLNDADADVRLAAAQTLGAMRNPVAIESLVLCLTDEEPAVRHAAAAALEQIDPRWVRTAAALGALPRLENLRGDPRPWIVSAAEKVLDKLNAAKDQDTEVWKRESGIRNL